MTARPARTPTRRPAPTRSSGARVTPGVIFLAIAIVGSIAYALYAVTVRDASQIPLLASGAVVLALAFGALTVYCVRSLLRAGARGRGRRALGIAIVGGGAAMATAGCLAGALILFQLAGGGG